MAEIRAHSGTIEQAAAEIAQLEDANLQAQELVQKGALHAMRTLMAIGPTAKNAQDMLNSLEVYALIIQAECFKRGLTVIHVEIPHQPGHG